MTDVSVSQNLNAHYSANPKAQRPSKPVALPPNSLPSVHVFSDTDANNRMKSINQDIYQDSKKEEHRHGKNFLKIFGVLIAAILSIKGIRYFFK